VGSSYSLCDYGDDCADCGVRAVTTYPTAAPTFGSMGKWYLGGKGASCDETCESSANSICTEKYFRDNQAEIDSPSLIIGVMASLGATCVEAKDNQKYQSYSPAFEAKTGYCFQAYPDYSYWFDCGSKYSTMRRLCWCPDGIQLTPGPTPLPTLAPSPVPTPSPTVGVYGIASRLGVMRYWS
jgi:hypothetical protein